MKSKKNLFKYLLYGFLLTYIISLLFYVGIFSGIDNYFTDSLYGTQIIRDDIVIIGIDQKSIEQIGSWPWDRTEFVEILNILNKSKVIGMDVGFFEEKNRDSDREFFERIKNRPDVVLAARYLSYENVYGEIIGKQVLVPYLNNDINYGYVNLIKDSDGIVRSVNLDIKGTVKSFDEIIYVKSENKIFENNVDRYIINFVGNTNSFEIFSFADVKNQAIPSEVFNDKIVLIGFTNNENNGFFVPTSRDNLMTGVEVHANILHTMFTDNNIKEQSYLDFFLVNLVFSLLVILTTFYLNFTKGGIFMIFLIVAYVFAVILTFEFFNMILNFLYTILIIIGSYLIVFGNFFYKLKNKKKEIKKSFSKYVSLDVAREIANDPKKLKLSGEEKNVTVFFSNIENFTEISRNLNAEDLVKFVNEYLSEMSNIIIKNKGTVDKFIRDSIMAFWGAPAKDLKHDENACLSSIEMLDRIKTLRIKWQREFDIEVNFRVGISNGKVVVGNMGSDDRFDYTVMGDAVGLALRLDKLNKRYGTKILVSENVSKKAKNKYVFREIDLIKVNTKKDTLKVFELICKKRDETNEIKKVSLFYKRGFEFYMNKKFKKAKNEFEKILDIEDYQPARVFIKRCELFMKVKPPKKWDGVFALNEK